MIAALVSISGEGMPDDPARSHGGKIEIMDLSIFVADTIVNEAPSSGHRGPPVDAITSSQK